MYNIGTVSTTANSPKITGTGTRWKDNTTLISVGQVVLIENGSNLLINSIYSIESNTALTLAFPVSAKLTNAKYIILTTMIDSISDGVNKATAQVIASEVYTEILNQWMTAQGTIDVELPTGQKIKLRTVAEMDKQLDGKLDKSGGVLSGTLNIQRLESNRLSGANKQVMSSGASAVYVGNLDDVNELRLQVGKGGRVVIDTGDTSAIALREGDFGIGSKAINIDSGLANDAQFTPSLLDSKGNGFYAWGGTKSAPIPNRYNFMTLQKWSTTEGAGIVGVSSAGDLFTYGMMNSNWTQIITAYTTKNTTKDAQGNLRAASPIIKVFADHIETNDESEGVTLEKLGVGRYKLKGVLGMNSDASWGGYNGGIVIPKGINGLELVWADYKVLADGDIILETHYRKHSDLPPPVVLNRLIAYPEFMDENGNELESYTPCDIPNGHWIDIRVQMPNDSVYNQKQAEAERLAKLEAERLAQEEAKCAAEEVERAE